MSEWQPARWNPIHKEKALATGLVKDKRIYMFGKVVRVRPTKLVITPRERNLLGCDAAKFYEIYPGDVEGESGVLICEHEILTD